MNRVLENINRSIWSDTYTSTEDIKSVVSDKSRIKWKGQNINQNKNQFWYQKETKYSMFM